MGKKKSRFVIFLGKTESNFKKVTPEEDKINLYLHVNIFSLRKS